MKKLFSLILVSLLVVASASAVVRTAVTGTWTLAASNTAFSAITTTADSIIIPNGVTVTVSAAGVTCGALIVQAGGTLTYQSSSSRSVTVVSGGGYSGTVTIDGTVAAANSNGQFIAWNGPSFTLGASSNWTWAGTSSGADGGIHYTGAGTTTIFGNSKIAGALQVSTGGIVNLVGDVTFKGQGTAGFAVTLLTATSRLNVPASTTLFVDKNPAASSTGTYSIVSGSKIIVDGTIDDKAGGTTGVLAGAGAITLNATAKYVHNSNGGTLIASAVNGAANVTWVAGSICEVKGITTTTSFVAGGQSFQNFIWNCAGQTSGVNFTGTLSSVAGNLDIQNSNNQNVRFTGAAALTLNITGDLKVSGLNGISKLDICNGTGLPVVNVAGNVIIGGNSFAATLLSANRSTLKVKGNWTNGTNGVYTPGAVTTVEFNSTTANQTITKSTAEAFHNLIINNSFGSIILATDVSSDSLTLTAGKVQTGVNKITEVVAGASLTGGSSTSYVNGNLVRAVAAGASTVALPIGDASNYTPVSIGLLAGTSAGNVTASTLVPGAAPAVGPTPGGSGIDQTNYINRNWTLVFSAAAVYNATFNYINPGDVAGAPLLTNLRVGKDNAGTWSNPAATSIAGSATTTAAGGLTTGGTFSLGDATGYFITVTSGPNGSVSPGTTYVTPGGNQSFTITPAGCYSIADVTVDGVPATPLTTGSYAAGGTYDFTSVTAAHTISVTFVLNTYTITVTSGANGSITPATGSVNCGATGTYTVTPDPGYLITDVTVDGTPATALTTGSYAAGGTYDFVNVTAPHSISATFAVSCINVSITSASASPAGPLCSGQTTTLSANGVAGTNAVVTWYTGPGATGSNLGTGTSLPGQGAGTYYAYVTGDCGGPLEQSVIVGSIGNTFTGTGDWTDNARWSCGAPPSSGDNVTIAAGANATLNTNFIVSGSLTMTATSTLTVNPTRTLSVDVAATANFNGQSVTFKSDATGTASLGQVNGTLSGATNVTVERYIPNNGFRSWRLLSVPTFGSGQTIRQAWQEGTANPLPQQNNLPNYGTQITGLFSTQSAAAAAGFDSITINAGMLTWNGASWSNVTSTNVALATNKSYFLYIRGERSKSVSGAISNSSATTLRNTGTVYTGDQTTNVGAGAFALVPNLYPSAINFTGLTRTGGVNNLFYIWDSKKLSGNSLGVYQTFSGTNSFNCLISGGSYTLGLPNTTIESGQSFFVTSGAAGTIVLKESAKLSGTNGSLGFRPSANPSRIDSRLYNTNNEMLDANVVVFDAAYDRAVDADDAVKYGNPGANFAIETGSKILAIEGTQPVKENDAIQFRMWNLQQQDYRLEFATTKMEAAGMEAVLEDSYLKTTTAVNLKGSTTVNFTVTADGASKAANRFRITFRKVPIAITVKQGYVIAPNPVSSGSMNLQFNAQPAGRYSIRIIGMNGQSAMTKVINHAGGTAVQSVNLGNLANGTYQVEIVAPDKTRSMKTLFVNKN